MSCVFELVLTILSMATQDEARKSADLQIAGAQLTEYLQRTPPHKLTKADVTAIKESQQEIMASAGGALFAVGAATFAVLSAAEQTLGTSTMVTRVKRRASIGELACAVGCKSCDRRCFRICPIAVEQKRCACLPSQLCGVPLLQPRQHCALLSCWGRSVHPTTWSSDALSPVVCPISPVQAVEGTRASLTTHGSIRTHTWHLHHPCDSVTLY